MTDKTATQNLTRTTGSDSLDQFSVYLTTLRDEVDARMTAHFYDLSRSQVPPLARISLRTPYTAANDGNARMVYDTVDVDTDGMADLSVDARSLTFNTPGYYAVGTYVLVTPGSGPATSQWTVAVVGVGGGGRSVNDAQGSQIGLSSASMLQVTAPGTTVQTQRSAFGSAWPQWTFNFATLWAYKVRDL